ncbi:MAG: branched-chain amino acid ABC transporter permease [Aestuariivirga sp.]|nr:branched-chain amino acid ABC transporter permease [Aestuariivirga sp.]
MLSHELGYWLQQFLNACMLASFYVPLAVAFALIQGLTNKIFLSFGDFAMYAAFAAIYAGLASLLAGNSAAAILATSLAFAVLSSSALGHFAATHVVAPLIGHTAQAFMIGSIGVSIALQEIMRLQSGARDLWLMPLFDGAPLRIFDGSFPVQIGIMQLVAMATAALATGTVLFVMQFTASGRYWKACSQSERLAKLCGVNTLTVLRWSCVGSAALANVSGWIIAVSYGGVSFSMGLMLGFKAMFASVIGGFGTVSGAIAGGIFLAFIETLWSAAFPLAYRDVAVFGFIILILMLKPEGLYSSAIRRESED